MFEYKYEDIKDLVKICRGTGDLESNSSSVARVSNISSDGNFAVVGEFPQSKAIPPKCPSTTSALTPERDNPDSIPMRSLMDLQPSPAINGGPSNAELDTGSHPGVQGRRLDFVRDETENGTTTSLSLSSLPRTFPCSTPASRDARCQLSTTAEEEHVSQEVPPYIVHQTPVTRLSVSQLPTPPTDVCNRITPTNKQDLDEME